MSIGISGLYYLGIVDGVAGCFLESYQVLNMVFRVGIVRVSVTVGSLGMITVVQVKRGLSGTGLLGVIVCKLKGREKPYCVSTAPTVASSSDASVVTSYSPSGSGNFRQGSFVKAVFKPLKARIIASVNITGREFDACWSASVNGKEILL